MCVNVVVRQVAGGDMRRMPEGEETIFSMHYTFTPKSRYTPFSAYITPKKLVTLLTLSDIPSMRNVSLPYTFGSLSLIDSYVCLGEVLGLSYQFHVLSYQFHV